MTVTMQYLIFETERAVEIDHAKGVVTVSADHVAECEVLAEAEFATHGHDVEREIMSGRIIALDGVDI